MKRNTLFLLTVLAVAIIFSACKNTKSIGKRLDGTWQVSSITIDGKELTGNDKPQEIKFISCYSNFTDLYNYCKGTLFYSNDSEEMDWYLYEKGSMIELDFSLTTQLNGAYEVVEDKRKHFEFLSFDGKTEIVLDK